ncbi:MAG: formylglycine-generating enzyme family protein, partial [Planctomycetota bacterium]
MKKPVGMGTTFICLLALAALWNCASGACPPADLNGDCLVNFLDFQLAVSQGSLLDLQRLSEQWLESDDETPTILGRVDVQAGEPPFLAVELVVTGKQRVERSVFQYECQVILTNLSEASFENAQLVMTGHPENMIIIDPHVSFANGEISPGKSATATDTCVFTVDRSFPIDPFEITWRYVAAPQEMVFIPGGAFAMGDSIGDGWGDELPAHTVTVSSFFIGKHEVTNQQYCDCLNFALNEGLITVTGGTVHMVDSRKSRWFCCDTATVESTSQIECSGRAFFVLTKSGRDMADDPMVRVGWYGAAAYCNW